MPLRISATMAVASGIYTDPYLVRMQYATYAPIWEGGGRFFDKIHRIDRMGRLNGVAGSEFCTMAAPDQDPAWTSPRVETRGHFLSSLRDSICVWRECPN